MNAQETIQEFQELVNQLDDALTKMKGFDVRDIDVESSEMDSLNEQIEDLENQIENFKPSGMDDDEEINGHKKSLEPLNEEINKTIYRSDEFNELQGQIDEIEDLISIRVDELEMESESELDDLKEKLEGLMREKGELSSRLDEEYDGLKIEIDEMTSTAHRMWEEQYEMYDKLNDLSGQF